MTSCSDNSASGTITVRVQRGPCTWSQRGPTAWAPLPRDRWQRPTTTRFTQPSTAAHTPHRTSPALQEHHWRIRREPAYRWLAFKRPSSTSKELPECCSLIRYLLSYSHLSYAISLSLSFSVDLTAWDTIPVFPSTKELLSCVCIHSSTAQQVTGHFSFVCDVYTNTHALTGCADSIVTVTKPWSGTFYMSCNSQIAFFTQTAWKIKSLLIQIVSMLLR